MERPPGDGAPADDAPPFDDLAAGPLLARNTGLNLLGKVLPLLVALAAIPVLISGLGAERFGILTLAWALIGYFSVFDLGIGRSLTQMVSRRIGEGERDPEAVAVARTGVYATAALGLAGGALLWAAAPWLVGAFFDGSAGGAAAGAGGAAGAAAATGAAAAGASGLLEAETVRATRWLAAAVPAVVSGAALRGLLEAHQRFGLVNAVLVPMGALLFAAPVAVLPFSTSLVPVFGALSGVRILGWAVFLAGAIGLLRTPDAGLPAPEVARHSSAAGPSPAARTPPSSRLAHLADLLRLGGWMTLSNLLSHLLVYADRFVIGAAIGLTAVAYYTTPFEPVTKILLAPNAVAAVFFPAFALTAARRPERTRELFGRSQRGILLLLFPVVLAVIAAAPEALDLWVGADFAREGAGVARWLALGVFFNGLAHLPFALVQGAGRPDISAKLHVMETPIYFALLWILLQTAGIAGAAMAWSARALLDLALLSGASARIVPETAPVLRRVHLWSLPACGAFALVWLLPGTGVRIGAALLVLALFAAVAWTRLLDEGERAFLKGQVGKGLGGGRG